MIQKNRQIRKVRPETRNCWWDLRLETRDPSKGSDLGPETRNPKGPETRNTYFTRDLRSETQDTERSGTLIIGEIRGLKQTSLEEPGTQEL